MIRKHLRPNTLFLLSLLLYFCPRPGLCQENAQKDTLAIKELEKIHAEIDQKVFEKIRSYWRRSGDRELFEHIPNLPNIGDSNSGDKSFPRHFLAHKPIVKISANEKNGDVLYEIQELDKNKTPIKVEIHRHALHITSSSNYREVIPLASYMITDKAKIWQQNDKTFVRLPIDRHSRKKARQAINTWSGNKREKKI